MLTKEQMDALPELVDALNSEHDSTFVHAMEAFIDFAPTLAPPASNRRRRLSGCGWLVSRAQGLLDPCYSREHEQWQKDALSINADLQTLRTILEATK